MISFPSSVNYGGSNSRTSNSMSANSATPGSAKDIFGFNYTVPSVNLRLAPLASRLVEQVSLPVRSAGSKNTNQFVNSEYDDSKNGVRYESPFNFTPQAIDSINNYKIRYNTPTQHLFYEMKSSSDSSDSGNIKMMTNVISSPALFNPMYNVQNVGHSDVVPLLMTAASTTRNSANLSDCSIKELVSLSKTNESILGNARYRYVDFMYCKDLGKVSNNHLITLRKFRHPVGDNIFFTKADTDYEPDIGRLVAWFDTEDNKLESILKYSYKATWKELKSKIQDMETREDDSVRGPLGLLLNSTTTGAKSLADGAGYGGHNLFSLVGAELNPFSGSLNTASLTGDSGNKDVMYRNYDNNRVYEPKDTVQDTHTYEGKLEFSHEISLVFSYTLRAYDAINPKSAFLDLIGNVLNVTYRNGKFWGGQHKFIGTPPNSQGWRKANQIIDEKFDQIGGFFNSLVEGNPDFGALSGVFGGLMQSVSDFFSDIASDPKGAAKKLLGGAAQKFKENGGPTALKGMIKNKLGRPALYAFDSLLSGADVGLWHLTIGNPKNPIAVMGNLIMTNADIEHSGPLGVDDFPTNLKVTVKLKPARSRDATEIGKMYTKGLSSIYIPPFEQKFSDFLDENSSWHGEVLKEQIRLEVEANKAKRTQLEESNKSLERDKASISNSSSSSSNSDDENAKAQAEIDSQISANNKALSQMQSDNELRNGLMNGSAAPAADYNLNFEQQAYSIHDIKRDSQYNMIYMFNDYMPIRTLMARSY